MCLKFDLKSLYRFCSNFDPKCGSCLKFDLRSEKVANPNMVSRLPHRGGGAILETYSFHVFFRNFFNLCYPSWTKTNNDFSHFFSFLFAFVLGGQLLGSVTGGGGSDTV